LSDIGLAGPADRGAVEAARTGSGGPVVAVVQDLFFVARIRETARLVGASLTFARSPQELDAVLTPAPRFVLLDLTAGLDYEGLFATLERARARVLAFTTHALARQTQPWHDRCERVMTKETLTRELSSLLGQGAGS